MTSNRNKILAIAGLITFINSLSLTIIIPILYTYGKEYGLSSFQIGILFGLYSIVQIFATPLLGRASDIYGRRPLLLISLFGTFVASLMFAFAPTYLILLLARALDGITGGNSSVVNAVIADSTTEKDRGLGFSIFGASFGAGFVIGPLIGSIIADEYGLNAPYIVSAIFAALAFFTTLIFLPETFTQNLKDKLDLKTILFPQFLKALFIKKINILLIVILLYALISSSVQFLAQPYLLNELGSSIKDIGYVVSLIGVINVFSYLSVKSINARFGLLKAHFVSYIFLISAIASNLLIKDFYFFTATLVIFAFTVAIISANNNTLVSINSVKEDQGAILGIKEAYFALGFGLGPMISGFLIKQFDSQSIVIILLILFGLLSIFGVYRFTTQSSAKIDL